MIKLKNKLSNAFYILLVAVFVTSCTPTDYMIVEKVSLTEERGKKYFVETNEVDFVTNTNYKVGDTLKIGFYNCN